MREQEILDTVYNHFIVNNGAPSYTVKADQMVVCQYRGPDGARCAIGLLIPDSEYLPEFEGKSIFHLSGGNNPERGGNWRGPRDPFSVTTLAGLDPSFLGRLQRVHDQAALAAHYGEADFHVAFLGNLRGFAASERLVLPS